MPRFFFNDTATTEIYTLSLHDALPILVFSDRPRRRSSQVVRYCAVVVAAVAGTPGRMWPAAVSRSGSGRPTATPRDRKSTRLNSSHSQISYAVFCLQKNTPNGAARYVY